MLGGALWSMLGIAALGLTRLLYNALIGRTGDPGRLAEVNAQVSLTFVVTFLTAAATGQAAAKFIPLTLRRYGSAAAAAIHRQLAGWTLLATVLALVVLAAAGRLLLPGATWSDLVWVGALTTAYGAYTFSKSVLYGYDRASRYAVLELLADVVMLLLTVGAVFWLRGVLLAPLVIGYAAFAIAAHFSVPRERTGPVPSAGERRDLRREAVGFVLLTAVGIVASQGLFQITMVVARHLTGGSEAGAYAAAMSLITPAFFLPRALALAFFPAAAEAVGGGDLDLLARHTDAISRFLALSMVPCFVLAAMLGGTVLGLVFGPAYVEAGGGQVFAVLVAGTLLYVIAVPAVNALSAQDLSLARVPPLASAAGVVLACVVWLIMGLLGGGHTSGPGVALGYTAATLSQAGVPFVLAYRRLGLDWGLRRWNGLGYRLLLATALGALLSALALLSVSLLGIIACAVGFLAAYVLLLGSEARATVRRVLALRSAK